MSKRFPFPNPVNETSARIVAAGAVVLGIAYTATGNVVVLAALTYGFLARVTTGPAFSPLGLIATRVITPRIRTEHKFVPGPPKRFAQAIGLAFGIAALVLVAVDQATASRIVIAGLVGAAFLESAFAFCLGCVIFGWLMRLGVVPRHICEECNDISARLRAQAGRTA
jgi:hypothetical protein